MKKEQYFDFILKQQKHLTPEMQEAVIKLNELQVQALAAQQQWNQMEKEAQSILSDGYHKLLSKYPKIRELPPLKNAAAEIPLPDPAAFVTQYPYLTEKYREIPELMQYWTMKPECSALLLKYGKALLKYNQQAVDNRRRFFPKAYRDYMDESADKGILLYFLRTPELPIPESDEESFILDALLYFQCDLLKTWFSGFFNTQNAGAAMERKQEDVYIAIELMNENFCRTAARNWFSLLESEYQRCTAAVNNYRTCQENSADEKSLSPEITALRKGFNIEWEMHAWKKAEQYYQSLLKATESPNLCSLIQGDYDSEAMEFSSYDTVRLSLLYLNFRAVSEPICRYREFLGTLLLRSSALSDFDKAVL